jgi:hypothetical protein
MRSKKEECPQNPVDEQLQRDIEIMKSYLLLKLRHGDWHGVSDAANDIREMVGLKGNMDRSHA